VLSPTGTDGGCRTIIEECDIAKVCKSFGVQVKYSTVAKATVEYFTAVQVCKIRTAKQLEMQTPAGGMPFLTPRQNNQTGPQRWDPRQ